jgi:hypothetical protein
MGISAKTDCYRWHRKVIETAVLGVIGIAEPVKTTLSLFYKFWKTLVFLKGTINQLKARVYYSTQSISDKSINNGNFWLHGVNDTVLSISNLNISAS